MFNVNAWPSFLFASFSPIVRFPRPPPSRSGHRYLIADRDGQRPSPPYVEVAYSGSGAFYPDEGLPREDIQRPRRFFSLIISSSLPFGGACAATVGKGFIAQAAGFQFRKAPFLTFRLYPFLELSCNPAGHSDAYDTIPPATSLFGLLPRRRSFLRVLTVLR